MHRLRDFRQYMDYMVRCSRFCSLHYFQRPGSLSLGWIAAPAAIVGAALVSLGIENGSKEAIQYVPVIALLTGIWLLLFYFLKAGRIVDFISTPVMGGFISGIALTIILMQIPKILGGKAGSGELPELIRHIAQTGKEINWLSVILGAGALILLRVAGKMIPKFPMAIVIMQPEWRQPEYSM